jgi:ribosomal protein S18 acetylase RimI-like enzyme
VGFVNVAWDGGIHGFILDTTVHSDYQHRGIGTELMKRASKISADRGIEWLHVDYEPHLEAFYVGCGYQRTQAGLLNLRDEDI